MFPLIDDEEWPPYPAESVDAVLLAHDLAEIVGVPWFVTNLSRGDIVRVHHDGIGYVGGVIVSRGGHSTLHVMAATDDELAPVIRELTALGADVRSGLEPPMLAVDVPENVSARTSRSSILTAAESMTCAFTVACNQHRARRRLRLTRGPLRSGRRGSARAGAPLPGQQLGGGVGDDPVHPRPGQRVPLPRVVRGPADDPDAGGVQRRAPPSGRPSSGPAAGL